ncbi:MAG: hypothetical protein HQK49_19155 [Oligoflexia bacterium]|nr:hypothetical protein [Oligoflexia bacterium]
MKTNKQIIFSSLNLIFGMFLLMISSCGSDKNGNTNIKMLLSVKLPEDDRVNNSKNKISTKAINASDIRFAAVGYKSDMGPGNHFPISIASGTTQTEFNFSVPNGNTRVGVFIFTTGQLYFDMTYQFMNGGQVTLSLAPIMVTNSPYKSSGLITVKNESGVAVANQRVGIKHFMWMGGYIYETTTDGNGQFRYNGFIQDNSYKIDTLNASGTVIKEMMLSVPMMSDFTFDVQYMITQEYCNAFLTDTTNCTANGCVWSVNTCTAPSGLNCGNYTNNSVECGRHAGCSFVANACVRSDSVVCTGKGINECFGSCTWNGAICMNSSMIDCSRNTTPESCINGCFWEPSAVAGAQGICKKIAGTDCYNSYKDNYNGCMGNVSCSWVNGNCESKATGITCSGDVNTCENNFKCVWRTDVAAVCMNKAHVPCNTFSPADCSVYNVKVPRTCFSDNGVCTNIANYSCSTYSDAACSSKPPCSWNSTANPNTCRNKIDICPNTNIQNDCTAESGCCWSSNKCVIKTGASCL